jgi:HJR/Mrr/RecB family endonuclease
MRSNFNGIIKEILELYPNIDLPGYLVDNLQLPLEKAEVLASRIEKQLLQKTQGTKGVKMLRLLEKSAEEMQTNAYAVDCLSEKEFEYFIKWLLGELGYGVQPENYVATQFGLDCMAIKDGEKVSIQAVICPRTYRVSEAIIPIALESKGDVQKALVITTSCFAEQARVEAEKADVELWDIETLNQKIKGTKEHVKLEEQTYFPKYKGTLLQSLLALGETKSFLIEAKAEGKYDVLLPGVKYPLLTFQAQGDIVTRCICRIKYNEPVTEADGEVIVGADESNGRVGPDDERAYGLVMQYLEQFLE